MLQRAAASGREPLSPHPLEMLISLMSLLHLVLVALVVVMVFTRKATVPFGALGVVVLFLVPVLGPLLVLHWNRVSLEQRDR